MHLTPDHVVLWQWRFLHINATMVYSWIVTFLLTFVSWLVTRRLDHSDGPRSRWQNALEVIVETIRGQIRDICEDGDHYLPFIGSLFLFIAISNLLDIVPGWHAPTGSLSTTAALAICVGVAVPVFGIERQGFIAYFRHYLRPTAIMLPFHLMSETSRNIALAVRLFGNIMSAGDDRRHPAGHRAFLFPGADAGAGPADGNDPGLHFRDPRDGVYCGRRAITPRAGRGMMKRRPIYLSEVLWTA